MKAIQVGAYAAPNIMQTVFTVVAVIFLPAFYAEERGVSLAAVGTAILFARLFDAVIDPAIGSLSDRTPARLGGRKLWLVVAAPLVAITTYMLFVPPQGAGALYLTVLLVVWYTAYSAFTISYFSWGAEVATGYKERTVLMGVRELVSLFGFCAVQGLVLARSKAGVTATPGETLRLFAYAVVIVVPLATLLAVTIVREAPHHKNTNLAMPVGNLRAFWDGLTKNVPYLRIVGASFLLVFGSNMFGTLLIFLIEKNFHLKGFTTVFILGMMIAAACFGPLTIYIANRVGKHVLLMGSHAIYVVLFAAMFFLPGGNILYFLPLIVCFGFAYSIQGMTPSPLIAESVDYFAMRTGKWQPGIFLSTSVFIGKLATAGSQFSALWLVSLTGFQVKGDNSPDHMLMFKLIALVIPAILVGLGGLLLYRYPITARRHRAIRLRLERSSSGRSPVAPDPAPVRGAIEAQPRTAEVRP